MKMLGKKIFMAIGLFFIASIAANAATVDLNAETASNAVMLDLTAGTYNVTAYAGTYTAWNAWGNTYGCDGNGANCTHGWINNYSIDTPETGSFLTTNGMRYETAELALLNALSVTFTLLSDATVKFFIQDAPYGDNVGGISLMVNPSAVPVPAAAFLFAPALIGFMGLRRKAKSA
ncbi:MAG: hypothetical protein COA95_06120 [Methylophaga sp.]|nr:MAG: hypothetical protein COA95_06120 [Methylophaga sp.]